MNAVLPLLFIAAILFLIYRAFVRTREVAAKIGGEPDPVRVAILQHAALAEALTFLERSDLPPDVIAERREGLLAKQKSVGAILKSESVVLAHGVVASA